MSQHSDSPLLLFYPTSPVHVHDIQLVMQHMLEWRFMAILYKPWARRTPGIDVVLVEHEIDFLALDEAAVLASDLPTNADVLVLGTAVDYFALDLMTWAKQREIPIVAIQEVAQLALNQCDLNNYDAPFDRLFLASDEEKRCYLELGYPEDKLRVSGLLANDRLAEANTIKSDMIREQLGISNTQQPIVYTTSPLRHRLAIHNKDDWPFREKILHQVANVSHRIGQPMIVKLHPNEDLKTEREKIVGIIPNAIVVGREIEMDELFSVIGVLVNRGNSQTSLEAVLRGIPTVVTACGLKTLFHEDGGAYLVEDILTLPDVIESALTKGAVDNSRVRSKHFYRPSLGVGRFIAGEIRALARRRYPADDLFWNWLIQSMLFVGRHDRALAICEYKYSDSVWQAKVCSALTAHRDGRVQDSIEAWLACADTDSKWFFPHYELAHKFQSLGRCDAAIKHARKAIELHPSFHRLWHEIPMLVAIMGSLKKMGNPIGAAKELDALESRGLVDFVPELLIEKAAQLSMSRDRFAEAAQCLQAAIKHLNRYPINETVDKELMERAFLQLRELARRAEPKRDYSLAEYCYTLITETEPSDLFSKYHLSRIALMKWNVSSAVSFLSQIVIMPSGPQRVVETFLSPSGVMRLRRYWPASANSILRPIKLILFTFGWAVTRLIRTGFAETANAIAVTLLVGLFVTRHLLERLRRESSKFARILRLRSYASGNLSSAKNCPICGAQGKFEYQNKQTPLFKCCLCDHVYARDLPDDKTMSALYGDLTYWERDRSHQGITSIREGEEWNTYLKARLGILERLNLLSHRETNSKNVFEIGCAEGMLLHALKNRGMKVDGCEMNRAVADEGIKRLGVDIWREPFEDLILSENSYDLVISFHTLEHMRFPARILTKIAHILRPDGAVLIEVPCGEEEYENTDHLHFFCAQSLRYLLNQYFVTTEILDNIYTNSAGVRIGSIYGVGRGVREKANVGDVVLGSNLRLDSPIKDNMLR